MNPSVSLFLSLVLTLGSALPGAAQGIPQPKPQTGGLSFAKDVKPLLEKYCWDCHGDGAKKGDLALDPYKDDASVIAASKVWAGVAFHVENWMMPPAKKEQPTQEERDKIVKLLDGLLNPYDPVNIDPGRVTLRRLNRVEYNNTVRDLLGPDLKPANDFPEDDTGYGFDTIGDVLALPPILMERYLGAAERVLEAAIPKTPMGSQKVTFKAKDLRGKGQLLNDVYALTDENSAGVRFDFPAAGEYEVRFAVFAEQAGPEIAKGELRLNNQVLASAEIKAVSKDRPQIIKAKVSTNAGEGRLGLRFMNDFYDPNAAPGKQDRNVFIVGAEIEGPTKLRDQAAADTAAKIFAPGHKLGETEAGAKAILQNFANRAFRRAAQPAEVERIMKLFKLGQQKGESFRESLKLAMKAVMVSPYFIYRIEWQPEPNNPQKIVDVNEFSLATRLSYFLWSSMPDDELLSLAFRNELRTNLRAQVNRMLQDPKAHALAENFAGQWLELRSLDVVQPDRKRYRFTTPLRDAMRQETLEFFKYIQRENRSVLEFVSANYSFLNDTLANHYGIQGVGGGNFRKVEFQPTVQRRGVLTHGSILTLTSDPTRTSPVKRGKWVMENILGISPPPPPPNVPPLDDDKATSAEGTVRQRLEKHRDNPQCASCHALIDPLGFGLENFDAVGAFRTTEFGKPLDTSGVFTTGQKFSNAVDLANVISTEKQDAFVRCLIKKMLTYALGRGVEAYDRPTIDAIATRMKKEGFAFNSLIYGIIESVPFQKRRGDAFVPQAK